MQSISTLFICIFFYFTVCFKIFDTDRDGILNQNEIKQMFDILILVANESINLKNTQHKSCDEFIIELKNRKSKHNAFNSSETESKNEISILENVDLTQEDFLMWNIENSFNLMQPFLDLLFEMCHIVLGLRPQCRHLEHDIGKYKFHLSAFNAFR